MYVKYFALHFLLFFNLDVLERVNTPRKFKTLVELTPK